jgi:membrane-associated protease RseP (regulator of RpoE activity)
MKLLLRGAYFGLLLLTYPLSLLHEYSHYFMARWLGAEVTNFRITVYDGETEFIPRDRADALLILLAPLATFSVLTGLLWVLNIKFGGVLFVLL